MNPREPIERTSLSGVSRPFWALFAVSFAGILVLVALSSVLLNRNAIQSSEQVFGSVISSRLERLATLALEYAYWDEAVANVVENFNRQWIADTIDDYTYETLGVFAVYAVDQKNVPVLAVVEGEVAEVPSVVPFGEAMAALIRDARASEDNVPPVPVMGFVGGEGIYYFAAAACMTTYTSAADISTDHVMVFLARIDQEAVSAISTDFMMPGLRITNSGPGTWQAGFPLRLYPDTPERHFVWRPALPGFAILPALLAGVFVAFLVMLVTAVMFVRRSNRLMSILAQAREKADRANRAKSEYLRNVTHEVRTPLNAIIGFADIIRAQAVGPLGNEKYVEYGNDIARAGNHVLVVVSDLLDLEKIEAGEMAYEISTFDAAESVEEAMGYVRQIATEKSITIDVENAESLPPVRSDRRVLLQMLMNLLSNAVKFTPPEGTVTCRTYRYDDASIAIEIHDTGRGLAPEQIPLVMEPFGQVRNPDGESFRGTGLGLPLTKKLTESLGGKFRFDSEPGGGTAVTLVLPSGG